MTAGPVVHRDQASDTGVERLERPFPLGHVVIYHAASAAHAVHHPARLPERGDEEPDARVERDVHVALHALEIELRGLLDQHVHTDRPRGQAADELEAVAELLPVHVFQRQRLHDADPAAR
jgi:hypothetical protein